VLINWEKKFETGISRIDKQHKQLVVIINKLHENVIIQKDGSLVNDLLMDLKIYTIDHFSTEEKMMKKYNYSGEDEHIKEHQKFINKISEYLYDVNSSPLNQGNQLIEFLNNWIGNHILIHDLEYVTHFKKQKTFLAEIQTDIL